MISINFRDPRPIYEQIKDGMRRLIVSGALPAGSKISSVREMATGLAINPSTIQRAYRELEAEGYLAVAVCHETDHLDGVLFIDKADRMLDPEELEETE